MVPQFRRSGLDKQLEDIVELVFIDAPNAATGPPEPDVEPFFKPPYYEWWNFKKVHGSCRSATSFSLWCPHTQGRHTGRRCDCSQMF